METTTIVQRHDQTGAKTYKHEDVAVKVYMSKEKFDELWEDKEWGRNTHVNGTRFLDIPKEWFKTQQYEWREYGFNPTSGNYSADIVDSGKTMQQIIDDYNNGEKAQDEKLSNEDLDYITNEYWG